MRNFFYMGLLFIFFSCSEHALPKGIIAATKMEKIIYDLLEVDEYLNTFVSKDTTVNIKMKRSIFYEQVFKLNNTNRKEFYTSYKYYQQHPDIQKNLFDSLSATLTRQRTMPPYSMPAKRVKNK